MSSHTRRASALIAVALLCGVGRASAGTEEREIEYLLSSIGASGCQFVRNGTAHPASEAEEHLRMKYGKGRRYIDSAEEFIEKAASGSSITGRPYHVRCAEEPDQTAASWLEARLLAFRRAGRAEAGGARQTEPAHTRPAGAPPDSPR